MMKVLFYNHTGQVSGAERVMLMILARLDRGEFEASVVCPSAGPLRQMVAQLGVRTETVGVLDARFTWRPDRLARYVKSFLNVFRDLRHEVVRASPDLVHANSIRAGLVAMLATFDLGTPVVWHLHDMLPRHPLSTGIRVLAGLSRRTRLIAVSEAVGRNFRGRLSALFENRVSVILNAIDLDKFQPDQTAKHRIRAELGLNGNLVFGIVGQLTPRKGQLELIRAFAQAGIPGSSLLIVGAPLFNQDPEYASRLEQEAAALGVADRVKMLGPRSDVGAVMQALDLLIVNSMAEPFGLVAPEAMASGTPVLATAVDGIPEIIEHGTNGWLIPARDDEALTEAIRHLSGQPELRDQLAKRGRQDVVKRFQADRYMKELEAFYQPDRHQRPKDGRAATDGIAQQPFVLQVSREIGLRGGSESVAFQLHRAWLSQGVDARVVTSEATESEAREGVAFVMPRLMGWLTRSLSPHLSTLFAAPLFTVAATIRAWRSRRSGIVLSHGDSLTGDVCIVHALNSASLAEKRRAGYYGWLLNPINLWLALRDRWMLGGRRYRRIVAISDRVGRQLKEFYDVPDDRIVMIPNGIDLSRFHPENVKARSNVRQSLGIAADSPLVLFVGSQYRLKGLEFAIRALAEMQTRAILLVVGADNAGPYHRLAEQMGVAARVIFAGARQDLPVIYPAADAFVLPTLYETFALVCLEAMASGVPVLACPVGGIEDYLRDGENGLNIQRDAGDIARKLDLVLSDPDLHARLRAQGLSTVRNYTWDAIADQYLNLFAELMREKQAKFSENVQLKASAFEV
jgi:UDP-glucose:(heptosyl)LPS alpha-1,3-glucosyltransferase